MAFDCGYKSVECSKDSMKNRARLNNTFLVIERQRIFLYKENYSPDLESDLLFRFLSFSQDKL